MAQKLPYEEIISNKLQALPVPDLADAIWARVERQLDIDLSTDNGSGSHTPGSGPGAGPIGWGLSLFVVALVSIFLLSKNTQKTSEPGPVKPAPQIQSPASGTTLQTVEKISPGTRESAKETPYRLEPRPGTVNSNNGSKVRAMVPDGIDSIRTQPEPLVAAPPPQDSSKKKTRGVSGLSDGDYRIVPKKDNR